MTSAEERDPLKGLEHVGYELRMMAHGLARLSEAHATGDEVAENAYLESMLLHVRTLTDFFLGTGQRQSDDMVSTGYGNHWTQTLAGAVSNLEAQRIPINKRLAHLTWKRVTDDPVAWRVDEIAGDVLSIAEAWCATLPSPPDADLRSVFAGHLDQARIVLAASPSRGTSSTSTSTFSMTTGSTMKTWEKFPKL